MAGREKEKATRAKGRVAGFKFVVGSERGGASKGAKAAGHHGKKPKGACPKGRHASTWSPDDNCRSGTVSVAVSAQVCRGETNPFNL